MSVQPTALRHPPPTPHPALLQVPLAVTAFACIAEWVGKTVKLVTFTENKSTETSFKVSNFTVRQAGGVGWGGMVWRAYTAPHVAAADRCRRVHS